jgi:hypothetical protein
MFYAGGQKISSLNTFVNKNTYIHTNNKCGIRLEEGSRSLFSNVVIAALRTSKNRDITLFITEIWCI